VVRDLMNPRRVVRVDSTLRAFVGHDIFYFASRSARARFLSDPLRSCRRLTDPVTLALAGLGDVGGGWCGELLPSAAGDEGRPDGRASV